MRTFASLLASCCLLACPKAPDPNATSETSTGTTTATSTPSSTAPTSGTQGSTGGTSMNATSVATTTGTTVASDTGDCGNFIHPCNQGCGPGEICVEAPSGDVDQSDCQPNPDGCVPTDPCSPACEALCGGGKVCEPKSCGVLLCYYPITCLFSYGCNDASKKCAPTDALGNGTWNGTLCVPIDPNPGELGEPCVSAGDGKTGVDSCDKNLLCLDGTCAAMCDRGSLPCPEPDTVCVTFVDSVLMLCKASCDPLQVDCPDGEVCVQTGYAFACVSDKSGDTGQYGDLCMYPNACDPGFACATNNHVPGCASDQCCTPYCDITQPNDCPDAPQQSCLPVFPVPPPGSENVGFCGVP